MSNAFFFILCSLIGALFLPLANQWAKIYIKNGWNYKRGDPNAFYRWHCSIVYFNPESDQYEVDHITVDYKEPVVKEFVEEQMEKQYSLKYNKILSVFAMKVTKTFNVVPR